jgi:NADH-quinone oxidoreductase subunit H
VAGFHTEYSSMKWAFFFLGEYAAMITACSVMTSLFLGGWTGPFLPPFLWFAIKVFALIFVFIWIRWTFPRFRYDQLMSFGWTVLLPATLGVILLAGACMTLFPKFYQR